MFVPTKEGGNFGFRGGIMNKSTNISNKKIIKAAVGIAIFFFVMYFCLWKVEYYVKIDKTVTALMISGDSTDVTEVEIKIKGDYAKTFIMNKKIVNRINCEYFVIDGFAVTQRQEVAQGVICAGIDFLGNNSGLVTYYLYPGVYPFSEVYGSRSRGMEWRPFGRIWADNQLDSFVIMPYNQYIENPLYIGENLTGGNGFNGTEFTAICYPADTRKDAINLMNDIMGISDYMEFE